MNRIVPRWFALCMFGLCLIALPAMGWAEEPQLPNILWITSEDNGPELGCYGDDYALTPHIDRLASRGLRYLYCWSNAPVCAPARTAIISGMYPPSTGSEHMRSMTRLPDSMSMFPRLLREAGYYCTNNSKQDYNLELTGKVWDESSGKAHWKNRADGQPFFAVFNHTISHESKIRSRPHQLKHQPAYAPVPAYHPDTPEVRHDWAQYYDKLTEMDALVGKNLQELDEAGLADDTIVFYYGDHGSGMPRSKRWPYNSGLHVPLIVYVPDKWAALRTDDYHTNGTTTRLVSFVDLAPTVLSLAGIEPPEWMQGHAFFGAHAQPPQPYIYGFRGRMDERYDMVRSVRNGRYIYIRNYMPHRVYGQYIDYMFQTPTTRVWKEMYDAGKLQAPQTFFWETKPSEELYDLQADPDEVQNLVNSDEHQEILDELRQAQRSLALQIRDVGFLPEAEIHRRGRDGDSQTPYQIGHDRQMYPLEQIMNMADLASRSDIDAGDQLRGALTDSDSAVRYWAAMGLLIRGEKAALADREALRSALQDPSVSVRVVAAEALGRFGDAQDRDLALPVLVDAASLDRHSVYEAMLALNALDYLDDHALPVVDQISQLPRKHDAVEGRMGAYVPNLIKKTLADLLP